MMVGWLVRGGVHIQGLVATRGIHGDRSSFLVLDIVQSSQESASYEPSNKVTIIQWHKGDFFGNWKHVNDILATKPGIPKLRRKKVGNNRPWLGLCGVGLRIMALDASL